MITPVVFIHWGADDYASLAYNQAWKYNEDVTMIVGKAPTFRYSMEVDRWFMLRDHMYDENIGRCLYLDSDVLLYKDVGGDFSDCDLAFSKGHSGHTMFVNNIEALDDFCHYIQANYEMGDHKQMVERTRRYLPHHRFADALGDMVLLNNFMLDNDKYFFKDTSKIYNNSEYDHNINTGARVFVGGYGFPFRVIEDEPIKLNSLHFQGAAKSLMKDYLNV